MFMNVRQLWRILPPLCAGRTPGQLVIQFTDHCNARCPQCGMRVTNRFARHRLDVDEIKRMLDAAPKKGIRVVSFTGGEPLLHEEDLVTLIKHAGRVGIEYIRTGTNGFVFSQARGLNFRTRINRLAESLEETPLRNFWISIDSALPHIHEAMRGFKGLIRGIEKALPIFHEHGIFPSANLGINRNVGGEATRSVKITGSSSEEKQRFRETYQDAFRAFYRFVEDLGFTIVNSCYPMSVESGGADCGLEPVYAATSEEDLVKYNGMEKAVLFEALYRTIPEFRHRIRIFSPRTSLRALFKAYAGDGADPYPCRGGLDAFFVDSSGGDVYPCGYRGSENMGKLWDLDPRGLKTAADCRLCDWECFRDPSELFGPLLQARSAPLSLIKKLLKDPGYFSVWKEDLAYYRACNLFDGRRSPDYKTLAKFRGRP